MTAPERIWADFTLLHDQVTTFYCQDGPYSGGTEYIRADRAAVPHGEKLCAPMESALGINAHMENALGLIRRTPPMTNPTPTDNSWDQHLADCHCPAITALEPQPDHRDEVIKGLVEALMWLDANATLKPQARKCVLYALAAAKTVHHG